MGVGWGLFHWLINEQDAVDECDDGDGEKPTKAELDALWPIVQKEIADEKATKAAAKAAALAKLGLTADEIAALFG